MWTTFGPAHAVTPTVQTHTQTQLHNDLGDRTSVLPPGLVGSTHLSAPILGALFGASLSEVFDIN